jgi:hypothetical protein
MTLLLVPPVLLACLVIFEMFKSRNGRIVLTRTAGVLIAAPVMLFLAFCGIILFNEAPRAASIFWCLAAASGYGAYRAVAAIQAKV